MSQREFLRQFDAVAFGAFADAGVGDRADYFAPGSAVGVPCTVLIDRDYVEFGDDGAPVSAPQTQVKLQLAEVEPMRFGRLVLPGESLVLEKRVQQDESSARWVVAHG
ncbi:MULTISPECIES: hypothetical protein [unclassified Xanthomonas]|uniref:head-tail joining protein n=1 Tax=unclassified Xanthomonas TaxID=2643310 RepID=UPI002A7ED5F4|nr:MULTISPECIES: hypothetical protein [unclassified Xanthomonas]MDY4296831.1 hypothetical protein [Xanthomonas sp. LF02-5]MDY4358410.1 hypothetical protein [Xanthomonas sp. LF04-12]